MEPANIRPSITTNTTNTSLITTTTNQNHDCEHFPWRQTWLTPVHHHRFCNISHWYHVTTCSELNSILTVTIILQYHRHLFLSLLQFRVLIIISARLPYLPSPHHLSSYSFFLLLIKIKPYSPLHPPLLSLPGPLASNQTTVTTILVKNTTITTPTTTLPSPLPPFLSVLSWAISPLPYYTYYFVQLPTKLLSLQPPNLAMASPIRLLYTLRGPSWWFL